MNPWLTYKSIVSAKRLLVWGYNTLWALTGWIILIIQSAMAHAIQPLELNAHITRDVVREYDGIENFNFQRIETHLVAPLVNRRSYAGNWVSGAEFTENRLLISGAETGTRRMYRFAAPIQYFPRQIGRFQHEWMLTPSYYSDESFIDQKRFALEYAWQLRYRKNRKMNFVGGLRNDSRFGGAGIYPIFGIESRPNNRIYHHWVFPNMYSEIQLKKRMAAKAFLQVNGGNWKYLLPDESSTETLGITDWKLGVSLRLKTKMPFDIVAEAGMRILGSGFIAGTTGSLSNSFFIGIGINTPFQLDPAYTMGRR
jgi:hypothetical protein